MNTQKNLKPHINGRQCVGFTFEKLLQTAFLGLTITFLAGCTTHPVSDLNNRILELKLLKETLDVKPIPLVVIYNKGLQKKQKKTSIFTKKTQLKQNTVNIYIEGDGNVLHKSPFSAVKPSNNPTSRSPIALKLMSMDKSPSLYLSRPCYGITPLPDSCTSKWWTEKRYSREVIDLMSQALDIIKKDFDTESFTLVGHSGGGVISVILASERNDVDAIITIASNIDHDLWTSRLGFKKLDESLNAVNYLPLAKNIRQLHFIGEKDRTVPPQITIDSLSKDKNAHIQTFPEFTHTCCWDTVWNEILHSHQNTQ